MVGIYVINEFELTNIYLHTIRMIVYDLTKSKGREI